MDVPKIDTVLTNEKGNYVLHKAVIKKVFINRGGVPAGTLLSILSKLCYCVKQ